MASWRPLAPFAALFFLLMLFAVGGMFVVAREADRSDSSRAREAVTGTFSAILARLDSAAQMNAATPIVDAISRPLATPAAVYGYLNFTSRDALGYYGAIVLNHDGTAFAATRFGLPWRGADLADTARLIAPVAARLPAQGSGSVHAIVRHGPGEAFAVAVTNVPPGAADKGGEPGADPPRRLAMIAPVATQIAPKMLPGLGLEDFRVVATGTPESSVTIPVDNGAPIVFSWRARDPGRAAVRRWAPAMAALLLTALLILAFALRSHIKAIQALEKLAHQDSLTGLANRSAFTAELDFRQARGETLAIGIIDLNGFKAVNDEYGHLVGDALLQAVATELARSTSAGDFVARLGGDEFAWISPSSASASRLRDTFVARIAQPLLVGQLSLRIGAATGIAVAHPGVTASELLAQADARLYENKLATRSPPRLRVHEPRNDGEQPTRRRSFRD